MATSKTSTAPLVKARKSKIHGTGVFALQDIPKGKRIIEYVGDRVSHAEADRRYEHRPIEDNHTFLFIVDSRIVIDAGQNGNDARFINHGCNPNCETVTDKRRIFIESIRPIKKGDELFYDYQIKRDRHDPPNIDEIFACRCGAKNCRGSMLEPKKEKKKKAVKKKAVKKKAVKTKAAKKK